MEAATAPAYLGKGIQPMATPPLPPPSDFVSDITNPFFDLQPGTTFTTQSPDGSEVDIFTVTRRTKVIDGVVCHVINDQAFVDGELVEKTNDYFAQDKSGTVWYFGEDTAEFENGKVVSTEATGRAGAADARPAVSWRRNPGAGAAKARGPAEAGAEVTARVSGRTRPPTCPTATSTMSCRPWKPRRSTPGYR